jgi:Type II restriction endonuclease EcoO109I
MTDGTPEPATSELAEKVQDVLRVPEESVPQLSATELAARVSEILGISQERAEFLVSESERLYINRMRQRFSELRVSERLKRTNPFLLRIRGAKTVQDWATLQVESALYASEEEAVGHLLEAIAKICFPDAIEPTYPDDFDFEVPGPGNEVNGYQVKMSWDCMPMSSRKNLSNTIRHLREEFAKSEKLFVGIFAPSYGKATTTKPKGQEYVSLASREFWERVGRGTPDYDVRVGEVCALLCSEFRAEVLETLVPALLTKLTAVAQPQIGDANGALDYTKLFRRVNR